MDDRVVTTRKKSILASLIVAAAFTVTIAVFYLRFMAAHDLLDTIRFLPEQIRAFGWEPFWEQFFRNLVQEWSLDRNPSLVLAAIVLLPFASFLALVFNALALAMRGGRLMPVTGLLHFISLNPASAAICLVGYLDDRFGVKNKPVLYAAIPSGWLLFMLAVALILTRIFPSPEGLLPEVILMIAFLAVNTGLGVLFSFLSCKNDNLRFRLLAGFFYVLGLFTIVPAVICLRKSGVRDRLLFFTAMFSLLVALWLLAIALFFYTYADVLAFTAYISIATATGVLLNFLAWKNGDRKLKIASGIFYVLGIVTVPAAVICFVSARNRKTIIGGEYEHESIEHR